MRLLLVLFATAALFRAAAPPGVVFKDYKLKNGLRVILSEDHTAPVISVAVTYNVGSRDEKAGHTGFAHLFEHMMFQGSENIGKGEHFSLVQNNGGEMNGTTNTDRTNYFEQLPANQLDLGLFLEADRMRSLVVNQANLDNQRNAVQEERRQGIDNQPYGKSYLALSETAYDDFGYKHSTIGSMEDLNGASLKDVQDFFKRYYAPGNAVIAIVGDFRTADAMKKVEQFFGSIPAQPPPPEPDVAEPTQTGERRASLDDPFAQIARVAIGYKVPPGNSPDIPALDVLTDVMSVGQSSRFVQTLVKEKEIALQPSAGLDTRRGTSMVVFTAFVPPGKEPAALEAALEAEIARLQTDPITAEELARVKTKAKAARYGQLRGSLSRARELSESAVLFNDPGRINSYEELYQKVTIQDVQRVAKLYLNKSNRTVIVTVPKAVSK